MKKLPKLLTLALIALSAKSALALTPLYDQSKMFYVPFSLGEYLAQNSRNVNNSFYGALGVGYNFTNFIALQSQIGYFSPDYKNNGQSITSYLWTVDARFNAANSTALTPYVLVGAGALKLPSTQFVEDVGLGLDYKLTRSFSFGASAKEVFQNSGSYHDTVVTGNLTWFFGGNKALPLVQAPGPVLTSDQQNMLQKAQTTLKPVLPEGVIMCKDNKLGNQAGCVTTDDNSMTMHLNVRFAQNKAKIQSQYATPIKSVGKFMNANPDTNVTLYGYASSEGPAAFNQKLSLQRAESVQKYLINNAHIDKARIQAVGKGTADPIASNKTLAGRQLNRRVEAQIPVPYNLDH